MAFAHEGTASSSGVRCFDVNEEEGQFQVSAKVFELGPDCLVILWGGTRPHIGAIGIGQVRPSLRDPNKIAATGSVFTYVGHKEDIVAKALSEELTRRVGRNTVVVAGIHWDNLTYEDTQTITAICMKLTDKIVDVLLSPSESIS